MCLLHYFPNFDEYWIEIHEEEIRNNKINILWYLIKLLVDLIMKVLRTKMEWLFEILICYVLYF